ncbi:hypothetical protein AB0L40_16080 [Patulibacter sp. NPDC049589]|uniref:hypothetical protein n=1 Tax=Patulibacter sp. NPDC049589 TaxID=3154731 RepID=UPI003420DEFE
MIVPRLALLTVTGALAAAGVTGCAQQAGVKDKDFSGPAAQVADAIRDLDDAYSDEQNDDPGAEKVCRSLLSKQLVAAFGGAQKCVATATTALKNADSTQMDVREIKIDGNVATAEVRLKLNDDEQRLDSLTLVREGTWKLDGSVTGKKGAKTAPTPAPARSAPVAETTTTSAATTTTAK